jgi:hypothetical protein
MPSRAEVLHGGTSGACNGWWLVWSCHEYVTPCKAQQLDNACPTLQRSP